GRYSGVTVHENPRCRARSLMGTRPPRGAASPTFTMSALDGQASISPDCVPLGLTKMNSNFQERIIAILQRSPNGLTSNEIAERLGATAKNVSSRLSKLAAYGIIGKTHYGRGPRGNLYRALTDKQATMWSSAH